MARAKSRLRRVLTARYLRWRACRVLVRACPPLGRRLGFFPDSIGPIEAADEVLRDETVPVPAAELAPDLAFLERCARYDSAAPDFSLPNGAYGGARTVIIRKAWIDTSTGSVLLPDRRLTICPRGAGANWNAIGARLFRSRLRIEGRAACPLRTANYYHLLVENGLRLIEMLEMPEIAARPLTLVMEKPRGRVAAALYTGLAARYRRLAVREAAPGTLVVPDEAVIHFPRNNQWEWPPLDRAGAERLAGVFDSVYGATAKHGERLYLTRAGAKLRQMRNEPALREMLEARGFETFVATDANHPEQIARFRAARIVVAVHGAGLTNLLFARPGCRVVEIFPGNFVKSPYWWMARRLGLEYRPVIGGNGSYDQHFTVHPDLVGEALD